MAPDALPPDGWTGEHLGALLRGALARLQHEAPVMNALNVFPVPDGDTGTNMTGTLQAALAELRGDETTPAAIALTVARGALMGARGNGGVILSQLLRGLAQGLADCPYITGTVLAAALEKAAAAGYRAVTTPVEGTMLTVARDAAAAARAAALEGAAAVDVLEAALNAARDSLARTPDLLPVLREAGVVDAGGHGVVAILEGALRTARGQPPAAGESSVVARGVDPRWAADTERLHTHDGPGYGYCTEFLIRGWRLPVDALRAVMGAFGDSLLVVGDEELVRVHVHTLDPGAPLSAAVRYGSLLQVKIDNMEEQSQRFFRQGDAGPARTLRPLGVVAVVAGEGLAAVFRSLGATVAPGGQTMNPSAAELLAAVDACGAEAVIVLPNNSNILMTAQQAATLTEQRLLVVPTTTVAQGIAALLALPPDAGADAAVAAMTAAAGAVRTLEMTRATRSAQVAGMQVSEGDALALLDGTPVAAASDLVAAVTAALDRIDPGSVQLVTVYTGEDAAPDETEAVVAAIASGFAGAEIETVPGGQPHYPYIIALE